MREDIEALKRLTEYERGLNEDLNKKKHRIGGNNRKKVKRKKARNGR
jgi:hypothetical protein